MVDFEQLTGLNLKEINNICFWLEQAQHTNNRYYTTAPAVRAAAIILQLKILNSNLEEMKKMLEEIRGKDEEYNG